MESVSNTSALPHLGSFSVERDGPLRTSPKRRAPLPFAAQTVRVSGRVSMPRRSPHERPARIPGQVERPSRYASCVIPKGAMTFPC